MSVPGSREQCKCHSSDQLQLTVNIDCAYHIVQQAMNVAMNVKCI